MRNLLADGILRHVTLFRSRKMEGWNLFLLIVSAYVDLPLKCFLIAFLLFAILVYSLWRRGLECFSLIYPLFDVIKAMWRFTLFKLEKSTVENNHPYWGGGVLVKVFLRCSSTESFLWQPIFAVMLWKICIFYLNTSYFKVSFLIILLAYILLIY